MNEQSDIRIEMEALKTALLSTNLCYATLIESVSERGGERVLKLEISAPSNMLFEATICVLEQLYELAEVVSLYKFVDFARISASSQSLDRNSEGQGGTRYCITVSDGSIGDDWIDDSQAGTFLNLIANYRHFLETFIAPLSAQLNNIEKSKTEDLTHPEGGK